MENISSKVWEILNKYIGNTEAVYCTQIYFKLKDIVNMEMFEEITIGSIGEGLVNADINVNKMYVDRMISVKTKQRYDSQDNVDVIMDSDGVKPGFTKFYIPNIDNLREQDVLYFSSLTRVNDRIYLSSSEFRDIFIESSSNKVLESGPSATWTVGELGHNRLLCFSCTEWPTEAEEWISRPKRNNWPSPDLILEVVNGGCLAVPIGNPQSKKNYRSIEWQISFSLAEKKLMHDINHTQMLCYGLLKLYLKHVIDSSVDCKGLLRTYFLKTSLFYCIEEDSLEWNDHNLIKCFWYCFKRLYQWVRLGNCPNYFIRKNNMFEGKIYGEKQTQLKEHLYHLYEQCIDSFIQIPILRDIQVDIVSGTFERNAQTQTEIAKINECQCDLRLIYVFRIFDQRVENLTRIKARILIFLRQPNLAPFEKLILMYWMSDLQVHLTQHQYKNIISSEMPNKMRYKKLQMLAKHILRNCMEIDISTGLLLYGTLCYVTGNDNKVVSVVEHILPKFKSFLLYGGRILNSCNEPEYITEFCGKGLTIEYKRKNAVSLAYMCDPLCGFYPEEIETEVKQYCSEYNEMTFIPPRVYCYVLLFLTYHRTQQYYLRDKTLNKLSEAADDKHFVVKIDKPLVSALLDRCTVIAASTE